MEIPTYAKTWKYRIPLNKDSKIPIKGFRKKNKVNYNNDFFDKHNGNWGFYCGIGNKIVVSDLDCRDGMKEACKDSILSKEEFNTLIVETRHGFHVYYEIKQNENQEFPRIKHYKNCGYSEKKFYAKTQTKYKEILNGIDFQGFSGVIVGEGSITKGFKRTKFRDKEIKKITINEWERIKKSLLVSKPSLIRDEFANIFRGKTDPNDLAQKTDKNEFVYWKYAFIEAWHKGGLKPEHLFEHISRFNKGFDLEKTKQQLAYDYHRPDGFWFDDKNSKVNNKPLSTKLMSEYFPNHRKEKHEFNVFDDTEEVKLFGDTKEEIEYDNGHICLYKNNVKYMTTTKKGMIKPVLIFDGKLEIVDRTIDKEGIDLYTFRVNDHLYNTYPIELILKKLSHRIYKGNLGKDILKRLFIVIGNSLKQKKPKYIIGFDNGWILPHLEQENNYMIITSTDYQKNAYINAKNMIAEYTEKQKEEIRKDVKRFLNITQVTPTKLLIIIGWSMSAPFKLAFLKYRDIFPHLYNYGERYAGKSSLEKSWITHFYSIYDRPLSGTVLESTSRLEDHACESTFPHSIQECHKIKNINAVPLLKDLVSTITHFDRKKSARETDVNIPKVAGFNLDSNEIVDKFQDPAFNSKCITNEFTRKDRIVPNEEWKSLYRKLKKNKLFSFIYDITRNWTDKTVKEKLREIEHDTKTELERKNIKIETVEKDNPRIITNYIIVIFGLFLFEEAFGLKFNKQEIFDVMIEQRRVLPRELKEQFYEFCIEAIKYEEDYIDDNGHKIRGSNPNYLQHPLIKDKLDEAYGFTMSNLRDFNNYCNGKFSLADLERLLRDAIERKSNIKIVTNRRISKEPKYYMRIKKEWLTTGD